MGTSRAWKAIEQWAIAFGKTRYSRLFMAAVMLLFSLFLFGANLSAQWWIIDDHEIMWMIGTGNRLSVQQYVPKLMETEGGRLGALPRFRPAYYALRLGEAVLWGKRPMLWYALRLCLFAFFGWVLWHVMAHRIGLLEAGLLTVFALGTAYWSDIFARLGPSETYAVFGLALFFLGLDEIARGRWQRIGWILLSLGTIVCAGSKENFVLLLLPLLYTFAWSVRTRATPRIAWWMGTMASAACGWIVVETVRRVRAVGTDVYGNSLSIWSRLQLILSSGSLALLVLLSLLSAFFIVLYGLLRMRRPSLARLSLIAGAAMCVSAGIVLSQLYFYNGDWPQGNRYDFPGMLAWPLALFVLVWYLQRLSASLQLLPRLRMIAQPAILMLCLLAALSRVGALQAIRQASVDNVRRTTHFTREIATLSGLAKEHPGYALVFGASDTWDYEPLFSYPRFLAAEGIASRSYLLWNPAVAPSEGTSAQAALSQQLTQASQVGSAGSFEPLRDLPSFGSHCILVMISGPANWPCEIQSDGNWRDY